MWLYNYFFNYNQYLYNEVQKLKDTQVKQISENEDQSLDEIYPYVKQEIVKLIRSNKLKEWTTKAITIIKLPHIIKYQVL